MLQSIGILTQVKEISKPEAKTKAYVLTVGVKNKYKNNDGEFKGKYGRSFIDHKYFADTPNKVKFVEETLMSKVEDKTPLVIQARPQSSQYEKNGETVYATDFIVEEIIPYL